MSRTDDLRRDGAQERGGSGGSGSPFVKWADDYAWVEGRLDKIWVGKYGDSATITVTGATPELATKGKDEDGNVVMAHVSAGDVVNVGLNSSALEDRLSEDDVGENVHIAFEGWQEPQGAGGNRYRLFTVLVLDERAGVTAGSSDDQPDSVIDDQAGSYEEPDDSMPF